MASSHAEQVAKATKHFKLQSISADPEPINQTLETIVAAAKGAVAAFDTNTKLLKAIQAANPTQPFKDEVEKLSGLWQGYAQTFGELLEKLRQSIGDVQARIQDFSQTLVPFVLDPAVPVSKKLDELKMMIPYFLQFPKAPAFPDFVQLEGSLVAFEAIWQDLLVKDDVPGSSPEADELAKQINSTAEVTMADVAVTALCVRLLADLIYKEVADATTIDQRLNYEGSIPPSLQASLTFLQYIYQYLFELLKATQAEFPTA